MNNGTPEKETPGTNGIYDVHNVHYITQPKKINVLYAWAPAVICPMWGKPYLVCSVYGTGRGGRWG